MSGRARSLECRADRIRVRAAEFDRRLYPLCRVSRPQRRKVITPSIRGRTLIPAQARGLRATCTLNAFSSDRYTKSLMGAIMGNHKLQLAIRAVLGGGSILASLGAANAQTAPATAAAATAPSEQLQEVVVTGSRISVPNQISISPVTFVSALDVQQTGATRVEDLLNSLPQVFAAQGSNISNASTGAASVNLRGLNDKRTLVLVNGFRLGPGDPATPASDINMIPAELIDSIEVLTGGASSVYGADAVAGVVNFKLNDHFEGVKLIADAGIYQHKNDNPDGVQQAIAEAGFQQAPSNVWTGAQKSIAFIAGLNSADGNGNATVYVTYRNIAQVLQSKYDYSACSLGSGFIGGPSANGGKFSCAG
ncbi:MAG TPA: TonB-dependent receptor plug domain-containing protein, partial [Steroidobacteraceae bacterium]|nr:TonB-dependent receptor plug domain-containing protein [Steroidobacteraceae bacterium]